MDLLEGLGFHVPEYLTMDYLSAQRAHTAALQALEAGQKLEQMSVNVREGFVAFNSPPVFFGWHFVANIPALLITAAITYLVYIGIKETKIIDAFTNPYKFDRNIQLILDGINNATLSTAI